MAFLLARMARRRREQRVFYHRQRLHQLSEAKLVDYRLPRHLIEEIVEGYGQSEWANSTNRSHALNAETEVSILFCQICIQQFKVNFVIIPE